MKKGRFHHIWGVMAFFYDRIFVSFPPYRKLLNDILKNLNVPPFSQGCILDAGCGTGLLSLELARRGYRVIGVDRSPEMLARAQRKKTKEKLDNLTFLEGDLNDGMPLLKNSFTGMVFSHSLYLLDNPEKTIRQLTAALPAGGEILMCNPCRKLSFGELCRAWAWYGREVRKERGILSFFFLMGLALMMGILNLFIQYQKKKRVFHCWDEAGITDLLRRSGFRVKWMHPSCLAESHLLLCAVKES